MKRQLLFLPLLALTLSAQVSAQSAGTTGTQDANLTPQNSIQLDLLRDTGKKGDARYEIVRHAAPGTTILQSATLRIIKDIKAPSITIPVPANTTYVGPVSAPKGSVVTYSIDNRNYSVKPKINVGENGKTVAKEAPINLYRSVRITLPDLKAGKEYKVSYSIKVN